MCSKVRRQFSILDLPNLKFRLNDNIMLLSLTSHNHLGRFEINIAHMLPTMREGTSHSFVIIIYEVI